MNASTAETASAERWITTKKRRRGLPEDPTAGTKARKLSLTNDNDAPSRSNFLPEAGGPAKEAPASTLASGTVPAASATKASAAKPSPQPTATLVTYNSDSEG